MNTNEMEVVEIETLVENDENVNNVDESVSVDKVDGRHNNPGKPKKVYNIHTNNNPYLDYLKTLPENTSYQYGLTIKKFLESLGQKTPKRVTLGEIEAFVNGKNISNNHLRSFYKWMIKNDVGKSAEEVQRAILIWLV